MTPLANPLGIRRAELPQQGYAVAYACNNLVWDGQSPDLHRIGWLSALREIAPD